MAVTDKMFLKEGVTVGSESPSYLGKDGGRDSLALTRNRTKAHEQGEDGATVANRTDHAGQEPKVGKGTCRRCNGHRGVSLLGCEGHGRTLDATLLH